MKLECGHRRELPRPVADAAEVAFICDEQGSVLDASATIRDLLGVSRESVRGGALVSIVARDDEDAVRCALSATRGGTGSRFRATLQADPAHPVHANVSAFALEVMGRSLTVCVATASDDVRRRAEERARRLADTHKVIGSILEISLEDLPLDELLQRVLDLILWIPWLSIERKGAIFLSDHATNTLVMKVQRGLSEPLIASCGRVPFERCLCGRAAASRAPVFAGDLDERHTTHHAGIAPHCQYCVPIAGGNATLGVITTYLGPGHEPSAIDLEFLLAVADTLAGVLIRRRADEECRSLQQRLAEVLEPIDPANRE